MSKEYFKSALIGALESLTEHQLNNSGIDVIVTYYNDAEGSTALERAVVAMEKYLQKPLPTSSEQNKKVKEALNRLAHAAKKWDAS